MPGGSKKRRAQCSLISKPTCSKHAGQELSAMGASYRRGESSFVDFLDARRAYNGATQSYIEARAEYVRSLYLIDATIGR
jgi:outer membrane protein TolC